MNKPNKENYYYSITSFATPPLLELREEKYIRDLETYCGSLEKQLEQVNTIVIPDYESCQKELWELQGKYNELEKKRQDEFIRLNERADMFEQRHLLVIDDKMKLWNENEALKKALDKACEVLETKEYNWLEYYPNHTNCIRTKEEWKEWCMKDE